LVIKTEKIKRKEAKMADQHETVVVFRKFTDGQVIALFPRDPGSSSNWYDCDSYMHVGQHSSADPGLVNETEPASPDEYATLKRELEQQPYGYLFKVQQRITRHDNAAREAEWKRTRKVA
jgi:hypothetical protein